MVKRASALPQKDSTQSEVSTISEDSNNIPTRITFPPCPPLLHMPSPPSHSFPHARISPFLSPRADLSNTLGHFPRRDTDFPRRHDNSWPRASLSPGTPCPPPLPSATTVTAGSNWLQATTLTPTTLKPRGTGVSRPCRRRGSDNPHFDRILKKVPSSGAGQTVLILKYEEDSSFILKNWGLEKDLSPCLD